MSFSKLTKLHVIIIGSVLCVIAAVAMLFFLIKPQREKYDAAYARWESDSKIGNAAKQAGAERAREKANLDVRLAQQALDLQMQRRMPKLDFSNRETGMIALWKEQSVKLGPLLESFAQDKNVEVLSASFQLPAPPENPNDAVFGQDVLVFPLGTVQVQGDFKSLMNNIRRWNNCSRLVMVSPPVLQGRSPELQAAYTITCYIYPIAKGGPTVPMAGGTSAQASLPGRMPR